MNYNKYIGLPYASNGRTESGVDCWGLARLFYRNELGIELPSYSELYSTASDPEVVSAINSNRDNWLLTTQAVPGDLCLFNIYGEPAHVGIYIGDNKFLHAREGRDSVVESLASSQWSKRFQGFYKYTTQPQVLAAGSPHPLKSQVAYDWTVAGTTVEDFTNFINNKYSVSARFAQQLAVTVDGVLIPRDQWATTVLQANQTVAYKSVAQGRNASRLLLTLAVVVAAAYLGPIAGQALAGAGASAGTIAAYTAVSTMAINMAGMALVNAIAPIRMPGQASDAGQAKGLNLFTGASNQPNRFGAIPVVLGKMRATGVLGATSYVDTLTDTSLLNLLIVWGFGPLEVTDICVGTNPIDNYYGEEEFAQDIPRPVTLQGYATDNQTAFNKLYGRDVEQQFVNVLLTNNSEDGNPWQNVVLQQDNTTAIDIAFSFPEGMRQLVVSGENAGNINEATAGIEIQVRKFDTASNTFEPWQAKPSYSIGNYSSSNLNQNEYTDTISKSGYFATNSEYESVFYPLYKWYVYAISDTGAIHRFDGAATDSQNSEPSQTLKTMYASGSYTSLVGSSNSYSRLPTIPNNGYIKLYTICTYNGAIVQTQNHLQNYIGYTGLSLTTAAITELSGYEEGGPVPVQVGTKLSIASGAIYQLSNNQPTAGVSVPIFATTMFSGVSTRNNNFWGGVLKGNAVWTTSNGTDFDKSLSVSFPYSGYYYIEAGADDEGAVFVDNRRVLTIPAPGYTNTVGNLVYLSAGTYPVRVTAKNSAGGAAGVACLISYTENGGLNNLPTPNTILVFGTSGFYYKRKDAFNFVYKTQNLPVGKYEIRVRRTNDDNSEPNTELRNYNKVSITSVTGYASETNPQTGLPQGPINEIPNAYLAKTAIRVQSTSKANGNVDGVNAIVHSIAKDWDSSSQTWISRPTSNPASLFVHVLTHPGNAYRIKTADITSQIDLASIQDWHNFCKINGYEFNSIVTQTQSVIDVLRDICAAGRASPIFIDGKWSVIVDKPKFYVTQHFTPHNSWGFEATKVLPRLPDAFRVTFADSEKAYQANEILVFNFGKTKETAEVFEELSLPGVTNAKQAKRLARWHLAQLKLRPETYTLNVDFEYLVCTRGDLVRVSHDTPLWGTGTGRIKSKTGTTLELSEPVYLTAGTSYQIRVRLNTISVTPGSDSALLTLATITQTGWYSSITVTAPVPTTVLSDNLYMIGELERESQELIVIAVEPQDNVSARITLADYSPIIYEIDLDSEAELPSFNANISGQSIPIGQVTITQSPTITSAVSSSDISEEISNGIYQNVLLLGFSNSPNLTVAAQKIEVQVVLADNDFNSSGTSGSYYADKSASSVSITGLKALTSYKARARYLNNTQTISGPWSDTFYFTNTGRVINNYTVPEVVLDLDGTHIVATASSELEIPADFLTYEYRMYKDTGSEDFWELNPSENSILVVQSRGSGRFNLLDVAIPRISTEGITYRVACRSMDNNKNYSAASALGSITVKTIQ